MRLQEVRIGELRYRVVHKDAYRPRLAEVEKCREDEMMVLRELRNLLPVRAFEPWRAAS